MLTYWNTCVMEVNTNERNLKEKKKCRLQNAISLANCLIYKSYENA